MARENAAAHPQSGDDALAQRRPVRTPSPVLARLAALRKEVRALSRQAQSVARYSAPPGTVEYRAALARVVDGWIRRSKGRRQLLCLGSAAELGVLRAENGRLCEESLRSERDEALQVLYWTSARRHAARLPSPAPAVRQRISSGPGAIVMPCADCAALRRDARRYLPHPAMQCLAGPVSGHDRYRCATSAMQWLRHKQRHELFVVWTPVAACL